MFSTKTKKHNTMTTCYSNNVTKNREKDSINDKFLRDNKKFK
jgi:hypothetical protein